MTKNSRGNESRDSSKINFICKDEVDDGGNEKQYGATKKARIIVRNLPFKNLSEKAVKDWFSEYGDIEEVKLLTKNDGKFVGCGFVQFTKVNNAAKAIHYGNQKEMSGRKIIVDWAVPKHVYVEKVQTMQKEIKEEVLSDDDDETKDTLPYSIDKNPNSNVEEDSDEESMSEESNDEDGMKNENSKSVTNKERIQSNDVAEGKTVFVRNIPFSATNDDLKQCFDKFGKLEYALVCIDKLTEHSKGTGFVKFKTKESADACLQQNNKIFLEDNPLRVSLAVSRDRAQNKKEKVVKDSRNLYLSKEGVIMAGSKAAKGVSVSDMTKRLEIEQWKSQILKNLNMFVSDKRLVIHNLPPDYDDARLKALFIKHTHPKATIKEAKVMRSRKQIGNDGLGISKEMGFVSFDSHEDALLALRNINNNPKIFTASKRPIVGFSIENKAVINLKQKRVEKSRAKLGIEVDPKSNKLMQLNRKQRRFIRRKQKIIEKRREAKKLKEVAEVEMGNEGEKKKARKRKMSKNEDGSPGGKKSKKKIDSNKSEPSDFCGIVSEKGQKVKLRTRHKLKNQVLIHKNQLKEEKINRKRAVKLEAVKEPKQKRGKMNLDDDKELSRMITKHKRSLEATANVKKWDER